MTPMLAGAAIVDDRANKQFLLMFYDDSKRTIAAHVRTRAWLSLHCVRPDCDCLDCAEGDFVFFTGSQSWQWFVFGHGAWHLPNPLDRPSTFMETRVSLEPRQFSLLGHLLRL
jgi:hypothetical protein